MLKRTLSGDGFTFQASEFRFVWRNVFHYPQAKSIGSAVHIAFSTPCWHLVRCLSSFTLHFNYIFFLKPITFKSYILYP